MKYVFFKTKTVITEINITLNSKKSTVFQAEAQPTVSCDDERMKVCTIYFLYYKYSVQLENVCFFLPTLIEFAVYSKWQRSQTLKSFLLHLFFKLLDKNLTFTKQKSINNSSSWLHTTLAAVLNLKSPRDVGRKKRSKQKNRENF